MTVEEVQTLVSSYLENRSLKNRYFWEDMDKVEEVFETDDLTVKDVASEIKRIDKTRVCRFCGSSLRKERVHQDATKEYRERGATWEAEISFDVHYCPKCGWWTAKSQHHSHLNGRHDTHWVNTTYHEGILRRFDVSGHLVPLAEIRKFISKHPTSSTLLHDRKFEQMVGSIYQDFFGCEVKHVGGPGDNGIDLWMLEADVPCLIQCKRRKSDSAVEGVQAVRDLVGSMVFARAKKGHLVTTAKRFSGPAKRSVFAKGLEEINIELTLVDRERLLEMLRVANQKLRPYWASLVADLPRVK